MVHGSCADVVLTATRCGAHREDLVRVKTEVDVAFARNLSDVVFNFLSDEGIRKSVLSHFNKQATQVLSAEGPCATIQCAS